jgi:poly-gamma-glutamate synthesis protein (capsule biosynthesis protein)
MAREVCRIVAFGDLMVQRRLPQREIAAVAELLTPYDLVTGNVDVVVSEAGTPTPKLMNLNGPRELAHDLKAMGIDLVSMANNHTMDFRAEGMRDSCQAFDEAGILHAGAGENLAAACAPVFVTVNQRTVAFLSVSCTLPPESAAGPTWPGIAPLPIHQAVTLDASIMLEQPGSVPEIRTWVDQEALERVTANIAMARANADIVLVALHCGVPAPWRAPSQPMLQMYEPMVCRALIDAGADAVLGSHAHELHSIEFYRKRPIAYCLGNFWIGALAEFPWMERESVLMELAFGASDATPEVTLRTLKMDDAGVPRLDTSGRAAALLSERSSGIEIEPIDNVTYRVRPDHK